MNNNGSLVNNLLILNPLQFRCGLLGVIILLALQVNGISLTAQVVDVDSIEERLYLAEWKGDTIQELPDFGNERVNAMVAGRTILANDIILKNSNADSLTFWFLGHARKEVIIAQVRDSFWYNGVFMPASLKANQLANLVLPIRLAPGDSLVLSVYYLNLTSSPLNKQFTLLSNDHYNEIAGFRSVQAKNGYSLSILFEGALLVMMLYTIFLYLQNPRDKLYLYYSSYLLFATLYMLLKIASVGPYFFFLGEHPVVGFILNEPLQLLMFIFYNVFVVSILSIRKKAPKLFNLIMILNFIYLIYAIVDVTYISITLDRAFRQDVFPVSRTFMLVVSVYLIIQAYRKVNSPLVNYILAGSVIFMVGNMLAMFYSLQFDWLPRINFFAINFSQMGIFGEALLFSMAIGYWIKLNNRERQQLREAYINQLEENQRLNEQAKQELTAKVEERTEEVLAQRKSMEQQKEAKLRLEYEKKAMEHELNALKLQMNPHFIFNSLNSIRYYILKNKASEASEFIANFARLLRMILHHSKQSMISLKDELKALELYMAFENERLTHRFTYTIDMDAAIDPEQMGIQPLLLQPFVENAIWHGLSLKKEPGHITIGFAKYNDHVKITIEDNGVGRKRAAELEKSNLKQKSYGLEITRERLDIINRMNDGVPNDFNVIDLYDNNGTPAGTRVEITLAYQLYEAVEEE